MMPDLRVQRRATSRPLPRLWFLRESAALIAALENVAPLIWLSAERRPSIRAPAGRLANVITVNMHEAKTRFSELVRAVEERNETVVLCRDGREVAEIRRRPKRRAARDLTPDPRFRVQLAPGCHPAEPLSGDEWPQSAR